MKNINKIAALCTGALLAIGLGVPGIVAATASQGTESNVKVFVCKYVGTPGVNEILQTGNNPISVSVNSIPNYSGVGSYFADAQGRSYVLAEDTRQGGGQTGEPNVSNCPRPEGPPPASECITAVWKMPSWVGPRTPTWPQELVTFYETSCYNLNVEYPKECGTQYQIDSYLNNQTTSSLLSGRFLNGPNNPKESFPSGAGWDKTYKLVKNSDCPPKPETKVEHGDWVTGEYGCDDTQVTDTREVYTTTYSLVDGQWVGNKVTTTEDRTRYLTAEEIDALFCPDPEPETKVEYGEWVTGEYDCDDTQVKETRTVTTTTYTLVGEKWVANDPVISQEPRIRDLTEQEIDALFCPGPQPEEKVEYGDWVDGQYGCGDTTVEQTRTVSTTTFILEGEEWIAGVPSETIETQTRPLTEQEISALDCSVPDTLAETGFNARGVLIASILGLVLATVGVLALLWKRHNERS